MKVLDFGLAKVLRGGIGNDLAAVADDHARGYTSRRDCGHGRLHEPGAGRGKAIDTRTDIWAFGCVLYEMLTARPAFAGETVSDTIAGILEREPDWTALPAQTTVNIRRLLRRCLEKDSKRRLRDIGDARLEIDEALGVTVSRWGDGYRPRDSVSLEGG